MPSFVDEVEARIYNDGFVVVKDVPGMIRDELESRGYKVFHIPDDPNSHVNTVMAPDRATFGDVWRKYAKANPVVEERVAQNDSPMQKMLDQIQSEFVIARERILENFVRSPGLVATLGPENLVLEFGDLEISTDEESLRSLDQIDVRIVQKMRFRRKTAEDA